MARLLDYFHRFLCTHRLRRRAAQLLLSMTRGKSSSNLGFLVTANGTQASFTYGAYRFFDNCYDAGCLRRDRTLEESRGVSPHLEEREPAFFSTAQIGDTIDKPSERPTKHRELHRGWLQNSPPALKRQLPGRMSRFVI